MSEPNEESKKETKNHYVSNVKFYEAMSEWKEQVIEAEETGEPRPPVTNYIGECFSQIAEHLSRKPNFINYPYRDDMIGDGVENCLMYAHNFDPEKSKNPFSYFTQIIYYAFLRRIEKEKKQSYVKYKMLESSPDAALHKWFKSNFFEKETDNVLGAIQDHLDLSSADITRFTPKTKKKKKKE